MVKAALPCALTWHEHGAWQQHQTMTARARRKANTPTTPRGCV